MSIEATRGGGETRRRQRPAVSPAAASLIAEVSAVVAVLAALTVYLAPTMDAPLLEKHAFRQTQTAWTAREFREGGLDLLHPKIPVFGEPFEAPFEFPLYQALATLPMELGMREDTALRLTCFVCFVLTALFLWGLVRYVAGPVAGVAAVVAFAFTPLTLVWSRTSMIEYLATAGAVGFTFALVLWRDKRRPVFAALALVAGLVGMLVKPTTAVFWIIPALAYRPREQTLARRRRRIDSWTAVAVGVPLLAAVLWTRHADAIKAASPVTEWLTGWNLRSWNFGSAEQRVDADAWWVILKRVGPTVVGFFGVLLVPAAVAAWRSRQRNFWLGIAATAVLPPLVFMNLYVHHDYYLVALSPAIAAAIGLGTAWVWSAVRPRWLKAALAGLVLVLAWGTLEAGRGYWLRIHGGNDDPQVMPLAGELASLTTPDDLVAILGLEWSPAVLYYAHRRGHMVTEQTKDIAFDLIHRDGYRHLLMVDPVHDELAFMERWRWVGALGPHLYGLADSPARLPEAPLVTADPGRRLSARLGRARVVRGAPGVITCGRATRIPAGREGTWIHLAELPRDARLFVGELAPVPARSFVFVSPSLAEDGAFVARCSGAQSLSVRRVVDAPPPR
jgi:Dolichyl-phosphate-mannose-protein mannosyltransferase